MKLYFAFMFLFTLLNSFSLDQTPLSETEKIEYLLEVVRTSDAIFMRNGKGHPGSEAAEHLRKKFERVQKSLLAPSEKNWTAEMFIEEVASKSSLSGKPYVIQFPDGRHIDAKLWLLEQLKIKTKTQDPEQTEKPRP